MVARVSKQQRQHRISVLLEDNVVSSQPQLVELLAGEGISTTQATVSRDLEELGAITVRIPGGERALALPELPTQQIAPIDHLRRVLGEWAVDVAPAGPLVVVRTPPGCAHVVASALDRTGLDGVVGTVAGDDTIMVAVTDDVGVAEVAQRLAELAGIELRPRPRRASSKNAAKRR
jgi:transcriptional regulator of arginine metabolism